MPLTSFFSRFKLFSFASFVIKCAVINEILQQMNSWTKNLLEICNFQKSFFQSKIAFCFWPFIAFTIFHMKLAFAIAFPLYRKLVIIYSLFLSAGNNIWKTKNKFRQNVCLKIKLFENPFKHFFVTLNLC